MINTMNIMKEVKENQVLLAGLGLSGAGLVSFWLKDIPNRIMRLFRREFTTQLVVTSQHIIFYELLKWIEITYKNKNFRNLKANNGQWGGDKKVTTSIGYGFHFIFYKKNILFIDYAKDSANQTQNDKEMITITKYGRSRKLYDQLIKDVQSISEDLTKIKLFKLNGGWMPVKDINKRDMNSIFIEERKKELLLSTIDNFISRESWYIDKGIPYQLGILLYGPPGTGKTSIIKALASYLDYNIYYLSAKDLHYIEDGSSQLPDKAIMVIEDIDSNALSHVRNSKQQSNGNLKFTKTNVVTESIDSAMEDYMKSSLSDVLNSIDGMFSTHGRILVTTTNHIENLDNALIRPGRIDLKIEISFINNETLREFMINFFPNSKYIDAINNMIIKPNITIAELQNLVLQQNTDEDIMQFCGLTDSSDAVII